MTVELRRTISTPRIVQNSVAVNGKAALTNVSSVIRASNANRISLTIVNDSAQVVYLSKSGTAIPNEGIRLNKNGGSIIIEDYTGAVSGIATGGSRNVTFSEVSRS